MGAGGADHGLAGYASAGFVRLLLKRVEILEDKLESWPSPKRTAQHSHNDDFMALPITRSEVILPMHLDSFETSFVTAQYDNSFEFNVDAVPFTPLAAHVLAPRSPECSPGAADAGTPLRVVLNLAEALHLACNYTEEAVYTTSLSKGGGAAEKTSGRGSPGGTAQSQPPPPPPSDDEAVIMNTTLNSSSADDSDLEEEVAASGCSAAEPLWGGWAEKTSGRGSPGGTATKPEDPASDLSSGNNFLSNNLNNVNLNNFDTADNPGGAIWGPLGLCDPTALGADLHKDLEIKMKDVQASMSRLDNALNELVELNQRGFEACSHSAAVVVQARWRGIRGRRFFAFIMNIVLSKRKSLTHDQSGFPSLLALCEAQGWSRNWCFANIGKPIALRRQDLIQYAAARGIWCKESDRPPILASRPRSLQAKKMGAELLALDLMKRARDGLPVPGFDPAHLYLSDLRSYFGGPRGEEFSTLPLCNAFVCLSTAAARKSCVR